MCGCYNSTRLPDGEGAELHPNMTLAELRKLWSGETFEIQDDVVVGGVVTSSDKEGNFYQTFTISDKTGAAEIMAGMRDLHNPYPVGCRIAVRLKGCAVGVGQGVLQIGMKPKSYSNYVVDYFYTKVLLDRHIVSSDDIVDVAPVSVACAELNVEMCGTLVRVEGVQLVTDGEVTTENVQDGDKQPDTSQLPALWAGYQAFADADGNRIYTYTSSYASFAAERVPTELCDITGILQYGPVAGVLGERFILKMRSDDDCTPNNSGAM